MGGGESLQTAAWLGLGLVMRLRVIRVSVRGKGKVRVRAGLQTVASSSA